MSDKRINLEGTTAKEKGKKTNVDFPKCIALDEQLNRFQKPFERRCCINA